MNAVEQNLINWTRSLFPSIPVGGLLSRSPVAYKWKAPFRVLILREAVFCRLHDLMRQSFALHQQGHGLGARILLRSGFETLATLIYLNQLIQQVLDGKLNFHAFGQKTSVLLLGSRNKKDWPRSLNIVAVLEKCDKRYPGLRRCMPISPRAPTRATRACVLAIRRSTAASTRRPSRGRAEILIDFRGSVSASGWRAFRC